MSGQDFPEEQQQAVAEWSARSRKPTPEAIEALRQYMVEFASRHGDDELMSVIKAVRAKRRGAPKSEETAEENEELLAAYRAAEADDSTMNPKRFAEGTVRAWDSPEYLEKRVRRLVRWDDLWRAWSEAENEPDHDDDLSELDDAR